MTATLRAAIPADWRPYSARDVAVIARPPTDRGWFCTTVLIGCEQVPADVALPSLLDGTATALAGVGEDVEELGRRLFSDDLHERASRLVCFDVPDRPGRVVQLQCFVALRPDRDDPPAGETRTVVQFAGTCALDELDRYGPVFVRVIESIRLDGGARPPD